MIISVLFFNGTLMEKTNESFLENHRTFFGKSQNILGEIKKMRSCPLPVSGDSLEFTHTQQTNLFAANLHHALVLEV